MTDDKMQQRAEEMANAIPQVLDALVGSTGCNADTAMDNESLANIPKLQAVADWLQDRLYWASRSVDSPYSSAKQVARSVINTCDRLDGFFLDQMSVYVECPSCYASYSIRVWCTDKPTRCAMCGKEIADDQDETAASRRSRGAADEQ